MIGTRTTNFHALVLLRAIFWEPLETEVVAGLLEDVVDIVQKLCVRIRLMDLDRVSFLPVPYIASGKGRGDCRKHDDSIDTSHGYCSALC